jgi:hypothetical protein
MENKFRRIQEKQTTRTWLGIPESRKDETKEN